MLVSCTIEEVKRTGGEITGFAVKLIKVLGVCIESEDEKPSFSTEICNIMTDLLKYSILGSISKAHV